MRCASRSLKTMTTIRTPPVVYALDGQWNFSLLSDIVGKLSWDGSIPDLTVEAGRGELYIVEAGCDGHLSSTRRRERISMPMASTSISPFTVMARASWASPSASSAHSTNSCGAERRSMGPDPRRCPSAHQPGAASAFPGVGSRNTLRVRRRPPPPAAAPSSSRVRVEDTGQDEREPACSKRINHSNREAKSF